MHKYITKLHQIVPRGNNCHTHWDHHRTSRAEKKSLDTQQNLTMSWGQSNLTLNAYA